MGIGTKLIACPSCSCHAFAHEARCPRCGAEIRGTDGSIQRTAGAVVLGLTLAVSAAGCSDEKGGNTGGGGTDAMSSSSMGGSFAISAYGVGPGGGFTSTATTGGGGGAGGVGGVGGAGGPGGAGGAGGAGGN